VSSSPPFSVVVQDDPAAHLYPLATEAAGRDEIFRGRVRQDPRLRMGADRALVVSDNVRKGAATNAVEIAESLSERLDPEGPRSRRGRSCYRSDARP